MIRHRSLYMKAVPAFVAAALLGCNDTPLSTSPRRLTPSLRGAGVLHPASNIQFGLDGNIVLTVNPAIQSVSDGQISGLAATVAPGATINFSVGYSRVSPTCGISVSCPKVIFLAYTDAGLPPVSGLLDLFDAGASLNSTQVSFGVSAQTTAPTTPGTYYIGLRIVDGSTPDNGAGQTGADLTAGISPDGAILKIIVVNMPTIAPTITGTLGGNGWYRSDVKVTWAVSDPSGPLDGTTGCDDTTISTDGIRTLTCTAKGAQATNSKSVTIKRDATPPSLTPSIRPASPNAAGWYNTQVTIGASCSDPGGSGVSAASASTIKIEGIRTGVTVGCSDRAGNSSQYEFSPIKIDLTAPTLTASVSPNPVAFTKPATATPIASDALSGLALPASCDPVNTSLAGDFTVKCTATDNAGNTTSIDVPYTVTGYSFSGFKAPITAGLMSTNSGRAIPVTFSLGGNKGMAILAAGSPTSQPMTCPSASSAAPVSVTATTVNVNGGLSYDATTDTYTLVWKTEKSWAGTCRTLIVKLADGTEHTADFQFTK